MYETLDPARLPEDAVDAISSETVKRLYEHIGMYVQVGTDSNGKTYMLIETDIGELLGQINGDFVVVTDNGIHGDWKELVGKESE